VSAGPGAGPTSGVGAEVAPATALARLAVRVLAAGGVGHVVLCPGSRSAPLAYALAASQGRGGPVLHVRHDERVAAFTALGVGLAGPTIGAVVTTSGTAVANLHPAVLEAHHADRPLVVVTADRPPRLRGTWANQTSALQAGLFGGAVRARLDLDDVEAAADPEDAAAQLAAALGAARGYGGSRPGPVHLNLGFADPLVPGPDDGWPSAREADPVEPPDTAWRAVPASGPALLLDGWGDGGEGTVVVAGDGATAAARWFAEVAGLPLLAEPSSGARGGPNAIGPYRLLLELAAFGGAVRRAVVFGRPTLSRPVTRLLERSDVEVSLVSRHRDHPDPGRAVRRFDDVAFGDRPAAPPPTSPWLDRWRRAGAAAAVAIDVVLDAEAARGRITGPLLARELWTALRPADLLLTAASNPVRDLDLAGHPAERTPRVLANRGLAGIDGTVSTATGIALGSGGPTRVLVGDVAFLHDVGALLAAPDEARPDLQVLVLDDDGGGIFSLLEHGARAEQGPVAAAAFDRLFGTPHGADLAALCRGFGVRHERVDDVDRLRAVLARPEPGTGVVQVPADRSGLRALHARLREAVHAAVGDAVVTG